jgi:hypothetical protein
LKVYRAFPTSKTLTIIHQDSWSDRMIQKGLFTKKKLQALIEEARISEVNILENI